VIRSIVALSFRYEQAMGHLFLQVFQRVMKDSRGAIAEIAAVADHSARDLLVKRWWEPAADLGVYRDVFEQSLLLDHGSHRPRNFFASLTAELLVVSLALLIPLAYSDHLPVVHWNDVVVRPAPPPLPVKPVPVPNSTTTGTSRLSSVVRPTFHLGQTSSHPAEPSVYVPDAPPSLGVDGVIGGIGPAGTLPFSTTALAPPPKPLTHPIAPSAPIRVGSGVQMAKLIRKVIPDYPALARTARISGVVHLVGTIAKDGTIRNLQLVDGHPMLAQAAISAVAQWVYEPTLLNGEPVEVIAPIEVNFTLGR
jgi:protein TonB